MPRSSVWSFPIILPTKTLYAFVISHTHVTCSTNLIILNLIFLIILGEKYKLCSSLLCSFLHPPVNSPILDSNILLSNLFSNTLNWCSFLNMRNQVSYTYKTNR
jgi:hypothetical protein